MSSRAMSSRVATLRCRYRTHGNAPDPAAVARLDRLATERLATELELALSGFDTDEAVYVVRRVRARTALNLTATADPALAHRWGRNLAGSVARAITDDPGDGANVVRFASDAEFVAAFVADLLTGTAWQRWYFGAFARHRHQPAARAIEAVLAEHRHDLAAILAALARRGLLESLLATIDPAGLGLPDAATAPAADPSEAEGWRPLVAAATRIVSVVDLWVTAAPDPESLLSRWAGTGHPQPDWRDPAALTDAVVAVIRWLCRTGAARAPGPGDDARLRAVATGLDWLDLPRLTTALATRVSTATGLPQRGAAATPRQRDLLTALQRAVHAQRPVLDASAPSSAANAARLLAALAESAPDWGADPLSPVLIERMLGAWAAIRTATAPRHVIEAVAAADPVSAIAAWQGGAEAAAGSGSGPPPPDSAAQQALVAAALLGEPAAAVLAALGAGPQGGTGDTFASPVAGLLLLQRVLLDVQLTGLAERHGYPPAGPGYLLTAVGLRWAGAAGAVDGRLDPTVGLLGGHRSPQTTAELDAAWRIVSPAAHAGWRAVVDDLVARHRLATAAPAADDPLDHTAQTLLRIWARWLPGFERSSGPFLLDQFVRRPGTVVVAPDRVTVRLPRRPLDPVLEIAGYLQPIEVLPGPAWRRIEFQVGELR